MDELVKTLPLARAFLYDASIASYTTKEHFEHLQVEIKLLQNFWMKLRV